jgi:hypothetical protein
MTRVHSELSQLQKKSELKASEVMPLLIEENELANSFASDEESDSGEYSNSDRKGGQRRKSTTSNKQITDRV